MIYEFHATEALEEKCEKCGCDDDGLMFNDDGEYLCFECLFMQQVEETYEPC